MAGKRAGGIPWNSLRPRRTSGWEERDGRIALLIPRFGRGRLGRTLDRWFRLRPYLLRLRLVTFLRTLERGGYIAIGAERGEATGDGSGS